MTYKIYKSLAYELANDFYLNKISLKEIINILNINKYIAEIIINTWYNEDYKELINNVLLEKSKTHIANCFKKSCQDL